MYVSTYSFCKTPVNEYHIMLIWMILMNMMFMEIISHAPGSILPGKSLSRC